jgi:hypothetical protein
MDKKIADLDLENLEELLEVYISRLFLCIKTKQLF